MQPCISAIRIINYLRLRQSKQALRSIPRGLWNGHRRGGLAPQWMYRVDGVVYVCTYYDVGDHRRHAEGAEGATAETQIIGGLVRRFQTGPRRPAPIVYSANQVFPDTETSIKVFYLTRSFIVYEIAFRIEGLHPHEPRPGELRGSVPRNNILFGSLINPRRSTLGIS